MWRDLVGKTGSGNLACGFLTAPCPSGPPSIGGPAGARIRFGGTRRRAGSRCHSRFCPGRPRFSGHVSSSIPRIPTPLLLSSEPPLPIGRTPACKVIVGSPMRRNQVGMSAAARRHGFRQLCVNSASTLRQLCVNPSWVPGAGRAAPSTDSFDGSAISREAVRCKGYRGSGNSASTLGQLCGKG